MKALYVNARYVGSADVVNVNRDTGYREIDRVTEDAIYITFPDMILKSDDVTSGSQVSPLALCDAEKFLIEKYNEKVQAIKSVRRRLNVSLLTAKILVDAFFDENVRCTRNIDFDGVRHGMASERCSNPRVYGSFSPYCKDH